MKTSAYVRYAVVALMASAPLFAQATENDSVQRCMDVFATQSFADRPTSFKVERNFAPRVPLMFSSGTQHVNLIASDLASGRVVAKANCTVRNGVTTVGEIRIEELIAAR